MSEERVEINDRGISKYLSDGSVETINWTDLTEVRATSVPDSPFGEDVSLMLIGKQGACCSFSGAKTDGLVDRLRSLPGFDHDLFQKALSCETNNELICWTK